MRGCTLNKKKEFESADFLHFKKSDIKKLGVDARIIIALIKEQPLKRVALCRKAGINASSFGRCKRLLLNKKVIKETSNGYSLYNFVERPSLWDRVKKKCLEAGGPLIDLTLERLVLGEEQGPYGHYPISFESEFIKGVIIPRGALELAVAASVTVLDNYSAFILTQTCVDKGDHVIWRDYLYEVKTVDEIYDGNELSYRVVKLEIIPK